VNLQVRIGMVSGIYRIGGIAGAFHPLLSEALFDRMTKAAAEQGWAVDYGFLDLVPYLDPVVAHERQSP